MTTEKSDSEDSNIITLENAEHRSREEHRCQRTRSSSPTQGRGVVGTGTPRSRKSWHAEAAVIHEDGSDAQRERWRSEDVNKRRMFASAETFMPSI